ncbi:LPXTG cell wall anchor domain-containing protein [Streptococcus parasanguinis]
MQVQKVSVSDKKAESAKLPNTGEEQSTSIALLGAVLGMFGLAGLAKRKKNED